MIENLQSVDVFSPTLIEILVNLSVSLICSLIVTFIYRFTYKGPVYPRSFVNSFIFLSMITTLVIMSIGNSLARAFGLVGALSIIRFRTAIKDTADLVYIFLALALGMSAGVGYYKLTIAGTVIIGLALILVSKFEQGFNSSSKYLLQFRATGVKNSETDNYSGILDRYCSSFEVMNIRTDDINNAKIYSFNVSLKNLNDADKLVDGIRQSEGISEVNLYFDQQSV